MAVASIPRGKTSALEAPPPARTFEQIRVDQIDVGENVRIDPGELDELAASIAELGVLQPVRVVGPHRDGRYKLVWGQRRLLAARQAGLELIPCLVDSVGVDVDHPGATRSIEQLVENLQRSDLNPIDEAKALRQVLDADPELKQEDLARRLGRSPSWLSNTLRLMGLDESVQEKIANGSLSQSHGKAIASLPPKQQRDIVEYIERDKVNARDLERHLEWKRQEAENDEAKAKRTAKMLPKALDALADVPKGSTVFVTVANSYNFDQEAIAKGVARAGFKTTFQHSFAAPEKGCKCKGTYRLEVDGRTAKVFRACTSDHWRRANDRESNEQRQEQAAARKAYVAKVEALKGAIRASLDVYAPTLAVARLMAFQIVGNAYSWPHPEWRDFADLDADQLRDRIAETLATEHRLREIPLDDVLKSLGVEVAE